jgi:hypothetical protein
MPEDRVQRAHLRLIACLSMLAVGLCAAPVFAQGTAQPPVNDRQVQAFFNGIALDQQLAEQYANPPPRAAAPPKSIAAPTLAPRPKAAVVTEPLAESLDEPLDETLDDDDAMDRLEAELDAALAGSEDSVRAKLALVRLSPAQIALRVLAGLALLAFAGFMLSMAVRELKKDTQQRKHTYRRRVKRRGTSSPVHVS